MENIKTYAAIDLKSFYASVECRERGLDPLTAKLVVADASRTSKTICLAVTPALKSYGLSGRSRLFEVEAKASEIKRQTGKDLDYIVAVPRMALYIEYSSRIYEIYLKYFSADDIHVYSIDEVFIDLTSYLNLYKMSSHDLVRKVIQEILDVTGITATAGIAPNLYLAKIAMDIVAKKIPADKDGVRIAELDVMSYRKKLWSHRPLTDFWRIGRGISKRLEKMRLFTMGDIAKKSLENDSILYKEFGIDAEILIDHAWGFENVEMKHIKSYRSEKKSLGSGQVLHEPYDYKKTKIVVREMAELLALDLFEKQLLSSSINLMIMYDRCSLEDNSYKGETVLDGYGRFVPKPNHGIIHLGDQTNSSKIIVEKSMELFDAIINKNLFVRKINIVALDTIPANQKEASLFDDFEKNEKENNLQKVRLEIMKKFGKNALLKGTNFEDGATTRDRNQQIGGHKA